MKCQTMINSMVTNAQVSTDDFVVNTATPTGDFLKALGSVVPEIGGVFEAAASVLEALTEKEIKDRLESIKSKIPDQHKHEFALQVATDLMLMQRNKLCKLTEENFTKSLKQDAIGAI